jgi:hypothetical protein
MESLAWADSSISLGKSTKSFIAGKTWWLRWRMLIPQNISIFSVVRRKSGPLSQDKRVVLEFQ